MYSIYSLTFPNERQYIGITSNFNQRMSQHKHESTRKNNKKLYRAIRKYGWDAVIKKILVMGLTLEIASNLEIKLIKELDLINNGYNISPGGYVPVENQSDIMMKRMKDSEYRKRALSALHSESSKTKRRDSLNTLEYKKLRSDIGKRQFKEGKCSLPNKRKPVMCIETGQTFPSIKTAATFFGGRREHLRDHLKGRQYRKKFKGYTFKEL